MAKCDTSFFQRFSSAGLQSEAECGMLTKNGGVFYEIGNDSSVEIGVL